MWEAEGLESGLIWKSMKWGGLDFGPMMVWRLDAKTKIVQTRIANKNKKYGPELEYASIFDRWVYSPLLDITAALWVPFPQKEKKRKKGKKFSAAMDVDVLKLAP